MKAPLLLCLFAAACGYNELDYDASARCQALGNQPGTIDYESCLERDRLIELQAEQRRELEERQRARQDQNLRRY